ncbi:choloylglycine hydrolase family protein [Alpinimonas psychrophila]|uniref:Choloylglycine hydrolase n=1 Tax=Alpinimonas psychrophila TaxID=748908 RepID=A0A7W3JSG3_9MICO|nr:linear amide C-N hydrolase [Alpinimonas psychrophila]MBA8828327.1 choloylglycine hydrolase [Alpinimonas psychrophila]
MCTNFKTPTAIDGTVTVGRSLEFPTLLPTSLAVLPSNHAGASVVPVGHNSALTWTASYGVVGLAAFGNAQWMLDGMNTAGLSGHLLYMPGFCTYAPAKDDATDVSEVDLLAFLLGTCGSVAEVKEAVKSVNVWGYDPGMGFAPPSHFLFHDTTSSIAIEFRPEGMSVVDNPTGVATNSPFLDWHLVNVNNYVGFSATVDGPTQIGGQTFKALGQGEGVRGMPGDYTPPSRFIRALSLVQLADQPKTSTEAEQLALHILNTFDIPAGLIKEPGANGEIIDSITVWDAIANLSELRYAYRTHSDPTVYVVDLKTTDFTASARTVELSWAGDFTSVTV